MAFIDNIQTNSGLAEQQWRRFVVRWAAASLLFIAVAAWFSYGFYGYDEHYQTIEFASFKLGKTPESELAWEYNRACRPWLQPAIYYVAARGAMALGVENPFHLAFIFRAIGGVCAWLAIVALMLAANVLFADPAYRRAAVLMLALFWFLPYLAVRTSCESLSADFFSLGLATLILGSAAVKGAQRGQAHFAHGASQNEPVPEGGGERRTYPWPALAIAGVCFGLAFEFRYQIAIAVAGVVLWVVLMSSESRRRGLAAAAMILAGVAISLAIGTAIDRWGYGRWVCAPWNYFQANTVEGAAARCGTSPLWAYFTILIHDARQRAPFAIVALAGMLICWIRHPRHILTWASLPFFVAHCFVSHKEGRFLFPLAQIGVFLVLLSLSPSAGRLPAFLRRIWDGRGAWPAKCFYALNYAALALVCVSAGPPSLAIQRFVYNHCGDAQRIVIVGQRNPYQNVGVNMWFYRPPGIAIAACENWDAAAEALQDALGRCLVITDRLSASLRQQEVAPDAALAYATYPEWVKRFNYFDWQRRSEFFRVYTLAREQHLPTDQTARRPSGDPY